MKTLFKPLFVLVLAAVTFSSCMKDDSAEREAEQRELEERIYALFQAESEKIQQFMLENPSETLWEEDDTDFEFPTLGETINRGFWFEVLAEPDPEEEGYEYRLNQQTGGVTLPNVRVTYSVALLDGTIVQSGENREIDLATFASTNPGVYNGVWQISFVPKTINYNEQDYPTYGLIENGLQKGNKIRVLSPSYFAFGDSDAIEGIPANSPLVYEFEVLEIE